MLRFLITSWNLNLELQKFGETKNVLKVLLLKLKKQNSKKISDVIFKACVRNFYIFHWKNLKNFEKCFLFYRKRPLRSRDIFLYFPLPLFFSFASHCWIYGKTRLEIVSKAYMIVIMSKLEFRKANCLTLLWRRSDHIETSPLQNKGLFSIWQGVPPWKS